MFSKQNILSIIHGNKKAPFTAGCLTVLSKLYSALIGARHFAYDRKIFLTTQLPVPVISVGNIVVGGTGKTPLVHLLAKTLQEKVSLAILTRGFKSQIEKSGKVKQISTGTGPLYSPQECGDEPYFLAQNTKAQVWVGIDRVLSGKSAIAQGANCLLLDDGMQHRRLARDFEIVILDANDPFSQGNFLPRGLLRDFPNRLEKADLIVLSHMQKSQQTDELQKILAPYTSAPLVSTQIKVLNPDLGGSKVGVFCGIGKPTYFLQTVRDLKSEIVDTFILEDHGVAPISELQKFSKKCKMLGAEALVCTEKDYVKLPLDLALDLEIVPIPIQLMIGTGLNNWEHLIEKIVAKVKQ